MAILNKIPYILLIAALGYIMFLRECSTPPPIPEPIIQTDTIFDTIVLRDTSYIPKISYQDTGSTKYIVDTVFILKEYFTKNFYQDTILSDSNGLIVVNDTIYQNRIKSRHNQIKLYPRTIYQTATIQAELKNKVFIGLGVNGWANKFGASANIALLTKRDNLYSVGYDPLNKSLQLNMYWKIRLRKD